MAYSFFDGAEEFVEFEKLFVHVDGGCLELLDFLGAVGEDEGPGRVRRRWRELGDAIATFTNGWRASLECKVNNTSTAVQYPHPESRELARLLLNWSLKTTVVCRGWE